MTAVDTNILVYAHRAETPWHAVAKQRLTELAESGQPWAIAWPSVHEFLAIVTHPRIFKPPTPMETALDEVECWLASPTLTLLGEMVGYWPRLRELVEAGQIAGPRVHDARIAALCRHHGVRVLWSADRDFSRFPSLVVTNPLVS